MTESTLSICICTSGRPSELLRCLESIDNGSLQPFEVVVSNDSKDSKIQQLLKDSCDKFEFVRFIEGPKKGLCANRNAVIQAAQSSHVSLLDDDAVVADDFVQLATALASDRPSMIFSGDVLESGKCLTPPSNPTRFGHFGAEVKPGELLRNVHLNCNIFPKAAFNDAAFDERLVYGYEDTDLCERLIQRGWRIEHRPELVNQHLPPDQRGQRNMLAERERFVVLLRITSGTERLNWRGISRVPEATLHAIGAYSKRGLWGWILRLPLWIVRGIWLSFLGPRPKNLSYDNDATFSQKNHLERV